MSPAPQQSLYLEAASAPLFASLHLPAGASFRDTGVVVCPPFGWDEVSAYRSLRAWSAELAQAGYPSLRVTLPSAGDSAGAARDPERLEGWTAAVTAATRWLRRSTGCRRVAALGIGLGGLVAYRAAQHTEIEDLVLWATPSRGRALVRELKAFAKLESSAYAVPGTEPPVSLRAGELSVGGFLLSAETIETLQSLDLTALALADGSARRVLLLERDGIAADARLREHLEAHGSVVAVAAGDGYAQMTAHPQQAHPPRALMAHVNSWLHQRSASGVPCSWPPSADSARIAGSAGATVKESVFTVQQPFGLISGILTEPAEGPRGNLCAVLLNAGAIRRIGPSRMWVEAARRWAARGVPTLRLDVEGIGDADGDASEYVRDAGLYVRKLVDQVVAALDRLQELGFGERFVVGGLCSGAYWSFHAALEDPRVVAGLMLNPRVLVWDPALLAARDLRRGVLRPSKWHKINHASVQRAIAIARWGLTAPRTMTATHRGAELDRALGRIGESRKRLMLLFSDDEPLHEELVKSGHLTRLVQLPNVTLEFIPVRDHTLRPHWAQCAAHAALDRALDRELDAAGQHSPTLMR